MNVWKRRKPMTDFNLRHNKQGAWEWEHDGTTYGTDPNGMGIWRKLNAPIPHSVQLGSRYVPGTCILQDWQQIIDRDRFHMPAKRTEAINHLAMYYGV
jgi:hypothetical protein